MIDGKMINKLYSTNILLNAAISLIADTAGRRILLSLDTQENAAVSAMKRLVGERRVGG